MACMCGDVCSLLIKKYYLSISATSSRQASLASILRANPLTVGSLPFGEAEIVAAVRWGPHAQLSDD